MQAPSHSTVGRLRQRRQHPCSPSAQLAANARSRMSQRVWFQPRPPTRSTDHSYSPQPQRPTIWAAAWQLSPAVGSRSTRMAQLPRQRRSPLAGLPITTPQPRLRRAMPKPMPRMQALQQPLAAGQLSQLTARSRHQAMRLADQPTIMLVMHLQRLMRAKSVSSSKWVVLRERAH